jgi:hypothetical protein
MNSDYNPPKIGLSATRTGEGNMNRLRPLQLPFIVITVFFVCAILTSSCTFKKPVSPSWDVQFALPLVSHRYTMRELAEDDKNIKIENDNVVLTVKEDIEPFHVGKNLRTAGAVVNKTVTFGNITDAVPLPDTVVVTKASIDSGRISVEMRNANAHGAHATFIMRELTRNGQPFTMEFDIAANQVKTFTQFLDGYEFNTIPSQGRNYIYYEASLTGGFVPETIDIRITVSEIVYTSMTGRIKEVVIGFSDVNADIDMPEEIEGIQIGSATAELTLLNSVAFPAQVDMTVKGTNKKNETAFVTIPATTIAKGSAGHPSTTMVTLANMQNIINLFPNKIEFSGKAKVGDNTTQATVTEKDSIRGSILFKAPLVFSLPARKNDVEPDTIEMKDEEARRRMREDAQNAKLTISLENSLPVGFTVYLLFSKRQQDGGKNLYNILALPSVPEGAMVDTLNLPIGTLGGGSPRTVSQPGITSFSITLTKKDFQIFDSPQVYQGMRIEFPGTQGSMVKVRPDDYITMHAAVEFSGRADFEDKKEGGGL